MDKEIYISPQENLIGIDEVGRGPLAGPVVVCGVILKSDFSLPEINDSKKLSSKKISQLVEKIYQEASFIKVVIKSAQEIDQNGIKFCVKEAMKEIAESSEVKIVCVDFERLDITKPVISITKGDQKITQIAAASIVAKHFRDKLMGKLEEDYPEYDFASHVGYGTKKHIEAIKKNGIIEEIHRTSFKPLKDWINNEVF